MLILVGVNLYYVNIACHLWHFFGYSYLDTVKRPSLYRTLTQILMILLTMRDRGVQHQKEVILRWVRNVAGVVGSLVEACYCGGLLTMMICHQMS